MRIKLTINEKCYWIGLYRLSLGFGELEVIQDITLNILVKEENNSWKKKIEKRVKLYFADLIEKGILKYKKKEQ